MLQIVFKIEVRNTPFFMVLYTKKAFLQHARYGNTEHVACYSAFKIHIYNLSSRNLHILRMIIIANEYHSH